MGQRGFTLIELLTVVGITAVVAGVAFPVFGSVRRSGQHTSCGERLHHLGAALALYANDHEGWLPPATTEEFVWSKVPEVTLAQVRASPEVLRRATAAYVKGEAVWFCPADPEAHRSTLWLGQRHRLTSYRFDPKMPNERPVWPPRMQFMRDHIPNSSTMDRDIPLLSDAVGLPSLDSEPQFRDQDGAMSNHSDSFVNAVRHDLGLTHLPAKEWVGSEK